MILASNEDLKKYVTIGENFVFDVFQPYIIKAVNRFTKKYVGNLHVALEDAPAVDDENKEVLTEAREHLQSAIANFGWFIYLPFAPLHLDSSGITVVQNEQRKQPEWWQIKDLRREILQSGHESMDLLLEVLEANPTVFTDYAVNYNTIDNTLLVNNALVFSKWYEINNSRQTYLALKPTLRLVEDQYIKTLLCPELIAVLKKPEEDTTEEGLQLLSEVREPIQKAIVNFTVSKIATLGLFILDDKGLRIDTEIFIDGRRQNPDYGKSVEQLEKLTKSLNDNGTNYLNIAKDIITENLERFDECENPLIKSTQSGPTFKPYTKGGVVGL